MTLPPQLLQTDRGKEFENRPFLQFLKKNGVKHFYVTSAVKASLVERFNRTLKARMFRYFTHQGSYTWVAILQDLVSSYNQTVHRALAMSPEEASKPENHETVWQRQEKQQPARTKAKLAVGDSVRISKYKGAFAKGYLANWSEEIFTVSRVDVRFPPPMYTIKDGEGEEIAGQFYGAELQKVSNDEQRFAIEKIIRRRGGRFLVKFLAYPGLHWVDAVEKI